MSSFFSLTQKKVLSLSKCTTIFSHFRESSFFELSEKKRVLSLSDDSFAIFVHIFLDLLESGQIESALFKKVHSLPDHSLKVNLFCHYCDYI